jgi:hypothetical protein
MEEVQISRAVQPVTDDDGIAIFRVSNQTPERVTYSAEGSGVTLNETVEVDFIGVDADLSEMSRSQGRVQANNFDYAEITVSIRDEDGDPFSDLEVELHADNGNSDIESVQPVTDEYGAAVFHVSSGSPGQITYSARALGTTISETVTVEFLGVDPDLSTMSVSESRIQANGSDQSQITVSVRDVDDHPFTRLEIELQAGGGSSDIEAVQPVTDDEGIAIFRVSNNTPEKVIYSAGGLGEVLSATVSVEFVPLAPVALSATEVETVTFTTNWEVVDGAENYILEVATDSSFSEYLSGYDYHDVGLVTSHTIDNASPGTAYLYRIRAVKQDLTGAPSNVVEVTTYPEVPTAVEASGRNAIAFTANWQSAEGAGNYRIDVSTDTDFNQILDDYDNRNTGEQEYFLVENLEPGTHYYYRVRSEAGPRISNSSNIITASTLSISAELSEIEREQLRTLANGIQTNEITVFVNSEEKIPLEGLTVSLEPDGGHSQIEALQGQTDEDGRAVFSLSNTEAESVNYRVSSHGYEIGTFEVEFLPDLGTFDLGDNYPNPFYKTTVIPVTVPEMMDIEIIVYDLLGRPVQTVIRESLEAGYHEVPFVAEGLAAGAYFYRLVSDGEVKTKRMVLIR